MSIVVDMANRLNKALHRRDYRHVPVPCGRDDDAYFEPLKDLHLQPETELYLGLVHYTDGVDSTRRRMATAQRHIEAFGIGIECGFGRRAPETVSPFWRSTPPARGNAARPPVDLRRDTYYRRTQTTECVTKGHGLSTSELRV